MVAEQLHQEETLEPSAVPVVQEAAAEVEEELLGAEPVLPVEQVAEGPSMCTLGSQ